MRIGVLEGEKWDGGKWRGEKDAGDSDEGGIVVIASYSVRLVVI